MKIFRTMITATIYKNTDSHPRFYAEEYLFYSTEDFYCIAYPIY